MYDYLDKSEFNTVVGSFSHDKNTEFKDNFKHLVEGFRDTYQMDAIKDITNILNIDTVKESYKDMLLSDITTESMGNDPYYEMLPSKMEQLFENSATEMLMESGVAQLAPIVGITLPVLKKSYIEGHAKDIVMTEVPTKPIIKAAFERRFLKDKEGNKHYIPDIFYDNSYKTIMSKGKGLPVKNSYYPLADGTLPFQDLNILELSGGSIASRDTLAYDFGIVSVLLDVAGTLQPVAVNINPNMAANSSFNYRVKFEAADGTVTEDHLFGSVDFYQGTVSCASAKGLIKKVQFGGHLSNENNIETIELDRERELMEWKIPDGVRINTGLSIEKIKDYKALFDLDITTEIISDMSTVLAQYEDSEILNFVQDSFDLWKTRKDLPFGYKDGFVEQGWFSCEPPANKYVTRSQWIETELKYNLNRFIDELKVKLRNQDLMFVVYGHPNNITLIQDNVRWIIDEDTKIGGIQLDYRFGVMTANKNRVHVVSTMKCPKERGLRVVAYPLTKETITFKHYKYSLNIENAYRNPMTPLIPNVMGTSRFITTEVLPVQGEFKLLDNEFALKDPTNPATTQVGAPMANPGSGAYAAGQTVVLASMTTGAVIHYTVDGSEPTAASPTYTAPLVVNATTTVRAIATKDGFLDSTPVAFAYTVA